MLCLTQSPPGRLSKETVWERSGTSKKYLDSIKYFPAGLGRWVPRLSLVLLEVSACSKTVFLATVSKWLILGEMLGLCKYKTHGLDLLSLEITITSLPVHHTYPPVLTTRIDIDWLHNSLVDHKRIA